MSKSITLSVAFAASLTFLPGAAHAQSAETFADPAIANGLSTLPSEAVRDARDCLSAEGTSRAVRACTKTLKIAAPLPKVRAKLHARRGLSQLALGRYAKAAADFQTAGRMDGDNMMAALGEGFAALMREDHATALARFSDCADSENVAALSAYGMAMSHRMQGNLEDARAAYAQALSLRPGWDAVEAQLATL